jgi:hypothetical protein
MRKSNPQPSPDPGLPAEFRERLRAALPFLEWAVALAHEVVAAEDKARTESLRIPCPRRDRCKGACDRLEAHHDGPYQSKLPGETTAGVDCDDIAVDRNGLEPVDSDEWLSVANAARIADVHRGNIARLANAGKLIDNGKTGRKRRVLQASLVRWMGERVKNQRMRAFAGFERTVEDIPDRH